MRVSSRPSISVVVPVYQSESTLAELVDRLERALSALASTYEVILVNDGSTDSSWEIIRSLAATRPWLRGICLMRNYGQHNALLCGIRAARYEVIVTLDDDLQHPPEEIGRLLERLDADTDVVYGAPEQEQHGLFRDMASILTKWILRSIMGVKAARSISSFRAFRACLRDAFADYRGPYVCIDVLLAWGTARFASVKVRHEPRTRGRSQYTLRKLVRHAINLLTGFSVLPLQLASWMGFAFTLFGMGVLVYVLVEWLIRGSVVRGFPFLASIIAIFSGAQLFALGILGEYLARMHFRAMDKPVYTIREQV